jgi:hypothetical protein
METIVDFLNWAWARHHNPVSWYIRPLFILPFCYFAYRKNVWGIVLTVIAVTSSMFWFPAPATPDPKAAAFLAAERQYITGPVTLEKLVMTMLVPIWFVALARAFRRRAWLSGAAIVVAGTLLKVAWSFKLAGESAWAIVPPVTLGTMLCAGVLLVAYRNLERVA